MNSERWQKLSDTDAQSWNRAEIDEFQAMMAAENMLKKMGISGFDVAKVSKAWVQNSETDKFESIGWEVVFSRTMVGVIPYDLLYYRTDLRFERLATISNVSEVDGEKINDAVINEKAVDQWGQETIIMYVDNMGIRNFSWNNALDVQQILQERAELLPFKQIQTILKDAANKTVSHRENEKDFEVDRISLIYHPVWIGKGLNYRELRPVWMISYNCTNDMERNSKRGVAIDAITGEIIDPKF